MRRFNLLFIFLLVALAALAVMSRHFTSPGVYSCQRDDTVYFINWTRQFAVSLIEGEWYPRWMPESHGGYGSPTFVFYAPLSVLVSAAFYIASGEMVLSMTLVKLAGLFLSGLTMFLFVDDLWGRRSGLAAALVYMALPFRVMDIYIMGLHAGKFAYVWYPLILYFARRSVRDDGSARHMAGLAVSYALLCLTHILSAYMFAPVFFAFGLFSAGRGRLMPASLRLLSAGFLGLSLAGFYLLPVLFETGTVHFETMLQRNWGHYWQNFPLHVFKQAGPVINGINEYPNRVCSASVLPALSLYLLSLRARDGGREYAPTFFIALVILSIFLMTPLSGFLWANIPGLKMMLFPIRWSAMTVLGLACLAGAGFVRKSAVKPGRAFAMVWALLFAASAGLALFYDFQIARKACAFTRDEVAELPKDMEVEEYVPKGVSLGWLREQASDPGAKILRLNSGKVAKLDIGEWGPVKRSFTVAAGSGTTLRIKTFHFPGWEAAVDGRPADLSAQPVSGAMLLKVPKGVHQVSLTFRDTPGRRAAKYYSALAGAVLLYLVLMPALKKKPKRRP